jgi:hypothetical protein
MLTSLSKCRACRLSWFPQGGAAAACPGCGGTEVGGTLELFHVGVLLILLAVGGWVAPMVLGDGTAALFPERTATPASVPAVIQSKETASVEKGPDRGETVTLRRGEEVTIVKQERRRVLVKDRRGNQVYVSKKKLKKRHKAKKRSEHVQR